MNDLEKKDRLIIKYPVVVVGPLEMEQAGETFE
jgi:hypothetical protein